MHKTIRLSRAVYALAIYLVDRTSDFLDKCTANRLESILKDEEFKPSEAHDLAVRTSYVLALNSLNKK